MKFIFLILILSLFIGNAYASIENEAGISAYAKATSTINLDYAKNAFRIIETQTSTYIIGSVPVPGLPDTEDAHVYVNVDGWILAYYMRNKPASKIVQWSNYNGGAITTTTLADVVKSVASASGVSISGIKYYDFKYPGANRLMMIVDWAPGLGDVYDSYEFKIPSTFILNENSWSYRAGYGNCCGRYQWIHVDGVDIPASVGYYDTGNFWVSYGSFSSILSPDTFHLVEIRANNINDRGINTVLIYREP